MSQYPFKTGDVVEHQYRSMGQCQVEGYGTTLLGWPVVILKDAAGVFHSLNPIYLRRINDMNALYARELENLPKQEKFEIQDINAANWAVRKIAAAQAAIKERQELAKEEIERINNWLAEETEGLQQTIDFFTGMLETYHRKEMEQNPKAKTIKLPYGTLKMRAQQSEFQRDDAALKLWITENRPEALVPQPPKLDWVSFKKSLQVNGTVAVDPSTGEVVPGITVIERQPKFSVEVE